MPRRCGSFGGGLGEVLSLLRWKVGAVVMSVALYCCRRHRRFDGRWLVVMMFVLLMSA